MTTRIDSLISLGQQMQRWHKRIDEGALNVPHPETRDFVDAVLALLSPDRPCIVDVSQIIAVSPDAADRFDILPSKELTRDEAHWLLVKALGEVVR